MIVSVNLNTLFIPSGLKAKSVGSKNPYGYCPNGHVFVNMSVDK
jgi:hypothetical protein